MRCSDPVERLFYSCPATLDERDVTCARCGSDGGVVEEELQERFGLVTPLCPACKASGQTALCFKPKPETRAALDAAKVAKKAAASAAGRGRARGRGPGAARRLEWRGRCRWAVAGVS